MSRIAKALRNFSQFSHSGKFINNGAEWGFQTCPNKVVSYLFFFRRKKQEIVVDFDNLHLVRPCWDLHVSFYEAVCEHRKCRTEDFGYPKVRTMRQFRWYLEEKEFERMAEFLPPDVVPSSAFWLTDGTHYLGSGDVRHWLNEGLMKFGGHIGYSIRPAVQNKGLGTRQLVLLLIEARKLGVEVARITCFEENAASARVIEKNGGVLVEKVFNAIRGEERETRVYDIEIMRKKKKYD